MPLIGCTLLTPQLTDNVFVMAVAIDYDDGQFTLIASVLNPSRAGGTAEENNPNMPDLLESQGETLTLALHNLRRSFPKRLNLSRLRVLVIGNGVAEMRLGEAVDFFTRQPEARLSVLVYAYNGAIGDVLSISFHGAVCPAAELYDIAAFGRDAGLFLTPQGVDIAVALHENKRFTIPSFHAIENSNGNDDTDSLESAGAWLFNGCGTKLASLPFDMTETLTQLTQSANLRTVKTVKIDSRTIASVDILVRNNSFSVKEGILHATISLTGELVEIRGHANDDVIEAALELQIFNDIYILLDKLRMYNALNLLIANEIVNDFAIHVNVNMR